MTVEYRTGVTHSVGFGGIIDFNSPDIEAGDFAVLVHNTKDGRTNLTNPIWDFGGAEQVTMPLTRDQDGGGTAQSTGVRINHLGEADGLPLGINTIRVTGCADGDLMHVHIFIGVDDNDPIVETRGSYGIGNPNKLFDFVVETEDEDGVVGGCGVNNTGIHLDPDNEGTMRAIKDPVWGGADSFIQQSSEGSLGAEIRHHYDWAGNNDNCGAGAVLRAAALIVGRAYIVG